MRKILNDEIIVIEQSMNKLIALEHITKESWQSKISIEHRDSQFNALLDETESMLKRIDLDYIKTHLRKRGYVREVDKTKKSVIKDDADVDKTKKSVTKDDADIDYSRFLFDADIGQSVWYRYKNGEHARTSQETLLKIVLGLRLNENEARYFLSLTGSGFAVATDFIDRLILSYIQLDYLGDEETADIANTVASIFQFYANNVSDKKLKSRLSSFYDL